MHTHAPNMRHMNRLQQLCAKTNDFVTAAVWHPWDLHAHTCTPTYIFTHIHTLTSHYIHTNTCTHTHLCNACTHSHTHAHMHSHIHKHSTMHVHTVTHIHAYTHWYKLMNMHRYMCMHIHVLLWIPPPPGMCACATRFCPTTQLCGQRRSTQSRRTRSMI